MTTSELKIQTVTGLIKRSPVTYKSHRYEVLSKKAGRGTRTAGVYAEKNWKGQIEVSFNTNGYSHYLNYAETDLAIFTDFVKAEGFEVEQIARFTLRISKAVN